MYFSWVGRRSNPAVVFRAVNDWPTLLRSFHAELTTRRSGKHVPGFDQQGRVAAKGSRRDFRQGQAFSAHSAFVGRAEPAISPSSGIGSHPTLVTFRDRASRLPCVPEGSFCADS